MSISAAKKIVLVDDEEDLSYLIAKRLKSLGFTVATYGRGNGAVEFIQEQKPELVLLDIKLPGLSGIEVYKKLKDLESTRHIPVIFISALYQEEYCLNTLKANGFLKKPFDSQALLTEISRQFDRSVALLAGH